MMDEPTTGQVIPLPLPPAAVARVAKLLLSRLDDGLEAGEITEAGYVDGFHWLETWTASHAARLGVVVMS